MPPPAPPAPGSKLDVGVGSHVGVACHGADHDAVALYLDAA
ncbi:hypothetical protein [Casimicrobium huifangae]